MPCKENHYAATKLQDSFNLFPDGLLMNITLETNFSVYQGAASLPYWEPQTESNRKSGTTRPTLTAGRGSKWTLLATMSPGEGLQVTSSCRLQLLLGTAPEVLAAPALHLPCHTPPSTQASNAF